MVGAFILFVPVLIHGPDQAGLGDVKWATFIGLVVGFPAILVALFVAATGLILAGLIGVALHRYHRHSTVPFAPFLCLGGICGLVWSLV
jgi:prepilin signal peptidase PulO-like enzyme (type II secretory pathway)